MVVLLTATHAFTSFLDFATNATFVVVPLLALRNYPRGGAVRTASRREAKHRNQGAEPDGRGRDGRAGGDVFRAGLID